MTQTFAEMERGWTDPAIARSYADGFAAAADQCIGALLRPHGDLSGRRVLDLCCGQGNASDELVRAGAEVIGLDFSAAMLEMARERVPDADFVEGDAMDMPFVSESFDGVVCGFGILHTPEPRRVLAEVRRVLRDGGRFSYSNWDEHPESALAYVFGAVGEHGDPSVTLPPGTGPTEFAKPEVAHPALERAGFVDVESETVAAHWLADHPAIPYEFFLNGTVRGGVLLKSQPEVAAAAIRNAVVERVLSAHGSDAPWRIPLPAIVYAARAA